MTKHQSKELLKIWKRLHTLLLDQKKLDFEITKCARQARAQFPDGNVGDARFVRECTTNTGVTADMAKGLLVRACLAAMVPDEKTYKAIGGFEQAKRIIELPKKEQIEIVQRAVTEHRTIANVLRLRAPTPTAPPAPIVPRVNVFSDAREIALFVAAHRDQLTVPHEIDEIVKRYTTSAAQPAVVTSPHRSGTAQAVTQAA